MADLNAQEAVSIVQNEINKLRGLEKLRDVLQQVAGLEQALAERRQQKSVVESEITMLQADLAGLKAERERTRQDMQGKLNQAEAALKAVQKKVADAEALHRTTEADRERRAAERLKELEAGYRTTRRGLDENIERLTREKEGLESGLAALRAQIAPR